MLSPSSLHRVCLWPLFARLDAVEVDNNELGNLTGNDTNTGMRVVFKPFLNFLNRCVTARVFAPVDIGRLIWLFGVFGVPSVRANRDNRPATLQVFNGCRVAWVGHE